jgi:hypothetical protein
MASLKVTTSEVLGRSRGALAGAEHGLIDMIESRDAVRQFSGIKTTVTSGRQVTFILQKLKSIEPEFESWWKPIADQMASDPLTRYFKNLRNTIEKEGLPKDIRAVLLICNEKEVVKTEPVKVDDGENFPRIEGVDKNLNPSGKAINIAVVNGGTYMKLAHFRLPDPPTTHLSEPIASDEFEHLANLYLDYLGAVWQAAQQKFSNFGT